MESKSKGKGFQAVVYGLFAVFYVWLAAQIPYTHDDWGWGVDTGMDWLLYASMNSRYAGNFLEVVMTRSELLQVLIMGSTYFLIPYFLTRFAAKELKQDTPCTRAFLFAACNCLILLMDNELWRQTYGWIAGAANFVISAVFLMLWIHELLYAVGDMTEPRKDTALSLMAYFAVCLCGQLFLENMAVFCVLLAFTFCILYGVRCRRIPVRIWVMLMGSLIGLVIMFSSSLYGTLAEEGSAFDGYRQISVFSDFGIGEFVAFTVRAVSRLAMRLYGTNTYLSIVVLLIFLAMLGSRRNGNEIKKQRLFVLMDAALIPAFLLCHLYDKTHVEHAAWMHGIDVLVSAAFFLVILLQTWLLFRGRDRRILLALWLCAPMVLAPLVVTSEAGPRLFLTSTIFLLLFTLVALVNLVNHLSLRKFAVLKRLCCGIAVILLCFYGMVYVQIGACKRERVQIIDRAVQEGSSVISLPEYPFGEFLFRPDPISPSTERDFKLFYGIPADVELIFE